MKKKPCFSINRKKHQVLLIMKIIFTIIILSINLSWASRGYSQNDQLSVNMKQKSVREVFATLEKSSGYRFFYNDDFTYLDNLVSVEAKKQSLNQILDGILKQTDFEYKVLENKLVVISIKKELLQVKAKVSGKVTDQAGLPMFGVTVSIKGTKKSTLTDANGSFSMEVVDKKATLVFSFIGFVTQEYKLAGESIINIGLVPSIKSLDEVVVIGYGTQKKGNLTGSVATVKSEELAQAPMASTTNTLAGRLPGLISLQSSGQPGSDAASLSIRGFGNALLIVDGIESDFNNIDPNQIASVSILKDGSASIYGSRAGNGVILITTKRGKDQKPTITFNSSYSLQGITAMPRPASAGQYAEMESEKYLNQGLVAPFSPEQIKKYFDGTDPQYPNTNWYKETIRDWTPQQQHNLSVQGGSDKIKYYGFFGYLDQQSIWKSNSGDYSRFNLQSNIDAKITDNLSIQLDLSSVIENKKFPWRAVASTRGDDSVWQDFWNTLPIYPATLPDPTKNSYANGGGVGGLQLITNSNITGSSDDANQVLKGTFIVNYNIKPIKGLSAKAFFNYVQNYDNSKTFNKPYDFYTYDIASSKYTLAGSMGTNASLSLGSNKYRNLTSQLSLNYDHTFGIDHHITALALYEALDYKSDYLYAGRTNFLTPAIDQLNAGPVETSNNGGGASEMGRVSYVGRLNYSYKDKYLLETSLRADASAKFPAAKRWGYFPSLSLGWRLNKENFIKDITAIDNLKLRASYGVSGLDNVVNFDYLSGYQFWGQWLIGSATQKGLSLTRLANPNLTWETIKIYNLGTDFSFWKRKLFGEADVFYRELSGIPGSKQLSMPTTFGADLPTENINSRHTRGFELMLGTSMTKGDFSYEVSGNVSWSREKWDHYEEPVYTDPDQLRINKVSGNWTDIQYGYQSEGLFTSQSEITNLKYTYPSGNASLKPGDIKYTDVNNDGLLDWKDQIKIGKGTIPHWMVGGNINLKYKNFDLSSLFQGALGYYTYVTLDHGKLNYPEIVYKLRWTENNNSAKALIPRLGGSPSNQYLSDYWYKDASYLRLKVLSIGYNVPKNIIAKFNLQVLRVYFAGTNLLTLSHLKAYGIDPEAPSTQAAYYYPQQKTITFGVNVSF